jgi:hypothetical protein
MKKAPVSEPIADLSRVWVSEPWPTNVRYEAGRRVGGSSYVPRPLPPAPPKS